MNASALLVYRDDASPWEKALYAFLSEKHKRSGSLRTVQGYSGMLQHFFGTLGKPPDRVISSEVFTWAHSPGLSGKAPSATAVGTRARLPIVVQPLPQSHATCAISSCELERSRRRKV